MSGFIPRNVRYISHSILKYHIHVPDLSKYDRNNTERGKKKNSVERKGRIAKENYVWIVPAFTSYRNYIPYRNSKVVVGKQHCHNNLVTTC